MNGLRHHVWRKVGECELFRTALYDFTNRPGGSLDLDTLVYALRGAHFFIMAPLCLVSDVHDFFFTSGMASSTLVIYNKSIVLPDTTTQAQIEGCKLIICIINV